MTGQCEQLSEIGPTLGRPGTSTSDQTVEVGGAGHNDVTRPYGLLDPRRVRGDYVYTFALS